MDRLVCGDVGFGKTEVALRAAFAAAISGKQVAVVVPTTLLARQHYKTFSDRFSGPAGQGRRSCRASCPRRGSRKAKAGLAAGDVDIVVGTHALAWQDDRVQRPRPRSIVDEEQHFGVAHKERLKAAAAPKSMS